MEPVDDPVTGEPLMSPKECVTCGDLIFSVKVGLRPTEYCRTAINCLKLFHSKPTHPQNREPEVCFEVIQRYDDDGFHLSTYVLSWTVAVARDRIGQGLIKVLPDGRIVDKSIKCPTPRLV